MPVLPQADASRPRFILRTRIASALDRSLLVLVALVMPGKARFDQREADIM